MQQRKTGKWKKHSFAHIGKAEELSGYYTLISLEEGIGVTVVSLSR